MNNKIIITKSLSKLTLLVACLVALSLMPSKQANAFNCSVCETAADIASEHATIISDVSSNLSTETNDTITFIAQTLWTENVFPGLKILIMEFFPLPYAIQPMIGGMIDGVVQNKAILEMQELSAISVREHIPSVSVCRFASLTKSLHGGDARRRMNENFIAKRQLEREIGGNRAANGTQEKTDAISDHYTRYNEFITFYCNPNDFRGALNRLPACGTAADNLLRPNRDINYTGLMQGPLSLNVDFSDNEQTVDERDVLALANNLFAHNLPMRDSRMAEDDNRAGQFINARSITAKRNVAQHSFNKLVGLKSSGSLSMAAFGQIRELGMSLTTAPSTTNMRGTSPDHQRQMDQLLRPDTTFGDATTNYPDTNLPMPSYYAQMEFLTQKIFQDPRFFAELYDNPENVERQYATLQALGLMQRREAYESMMRTELLTSLLLETEIENKKINLK